MEHVSSLQALLLGLLTVVALLGGLARRLSVSYPILLVLVGLFCSLLPHVPRIPLSPDLVLYVFLPPLLYAAAWQTSWREFRHNLVPIVSLAVGLVFFTAVGVALIAHFFLPGFDWRLGFLLGAIVSPTDAVAATSIARRLHMPHAILDILEGESLINDATGLLALQFGLAMIVNGSNPSLGKATLDFLWLLGGGIGIGLLVGWIVTWLERWIVDGPIEIALSVIVGYASYLAGDAAHASGVISVVVCGLFLSRRSSQLFSAQSRLQLVSVWNAVEFLLNGVVFLLIGLQLPQVLEGIQGYSLWRLCISGLTFSAVLIGLRLLWVYPSARAAFLVRTRLLRQSHQMPAPRSLFVIGWTGMRGVVAVAAAGSLPFTVADGRLLPQRSLIVFFTFSVVLVTLVLQGLTLPVLIRALGFSDDRKLEYEEGKARRLLLQTAITYLEERRPENGEADWPSYDSVLRRFQDRLGELDAQEAAEQPDSAKQVTSRTLILDTYEHQRSELNALRSAGHIGDAVYRVLQRELDLGESGIVSRA